jgi:hypothetical protein
MGNSSIESVYAFKKDSINTNKMTGYELEPLNSYSPTFRNQIINILFFTFRRKKRIK